MAEVGLNTVCWFPESHAASAMQIGKQRLFVYLTPREMSMLMILQDSGKGAMKGPISIDLLG